MSWIWVKATNLSRYIYNQLLSESGSRWRNVPNSPYISTLCGGQFLRYRPPFDSESGIQGSKASSLGGRSSTSNSWTSCRWVGWKPQAKPWERWKMIVVFGRRIEGAHKCRTWNNWMWRRLTWKSCNFLQNKWTSQTQINIDTNTLEKKQHTLHSTNVFCVVGTGLLAEKHVSNIYCASTLTVGET